MFIGFRLCVLAIVIRHVLVANHHSLFLVERVEGDHNAQEAREEYQDRAEEAHEETVLELLPLDEECVDLGVPHQVGRHVLHTTVHQVMGHLDRRLGGTPHKEALDEEEDADDAVEHVDENDGFFVAHQDGLLVVDVVAHPLPKIA